MVDKCFRCGTTIHAPNLQQAIERVETYRKNFPQTWDEEKPVLVCDDCFDEIDAETSDFEKSQL